MRGSKIPLFVGIISFALAVAIGASTIFGPGQEGSVGSRPGIIWVGVLFVIGALCALAHALQPAAIRSPRAVFDGSATKRATVSSGPARSRRERTEDVVSQAGLPFGLPEYVAACLVGAVFAALGGLVLLGPVGGVALPAAVVTGATVWPNIAANRRTARFNEQLPDALMVVASGMRAGQSLPRALDMLARSSEAPMSEELTRALAESNVGRSLVDALIDVAARTRSDAFGWVAEAIATNRKLGGNLAGVLETSAETIRAREKVNKKVRAVSAEGRASAVVLIALPIVLSIVVLRLNPSYMSPLWTDDTGRLLLGGAIALLVSGSMWIRRLVRVEF